MSLSGNMNAAAVSGALDRFNAAVMRIRRPRLSKSDKEAILTSLRQSAKALGWEVPAYNTAEFSSWLEQEAAAVLHRMRAARIQAA